MWPTTRKTFTFNVVTMETNPGWAWMTSPRRGTSLGRIAVRATLQLGRRLSQIILMKKTVCTPLVWDTTMNGMTWNAVIVISTLVRKVGLTLGLFIPGKIRRVLNKTRTLTYIRACEVYKTRTAYFWSRNRFRGKVAVRNGNPTWHVSKLRRHVGILQRRQFKTFLIRMRGSSLLTKLSFTAK